MNSTFYRGFPGRIEKIAMTRHRIEYGSSVFLEREVSKQLAKGQAREKLAKLLALQNWQRLFVGARSDPYLTTCFSLFHRPISQASVVLHATRKKNLHPTALADGASDNA